MKILAAADNEYSRICPYPICSKRFLANHLNRKYCSSQCKRRHERMKKSLERKSTKLINDALLKNRKILLTLCQKDTFVVSMDQLSSSGFEPKIITGIDTSKKIFYIYEFKIEYNTKSECKISKIS